MVGNNRGWGTDTQPVTDHDCPPCYCQLCYPDESNRVDPAVTGLTIQMKCKHFVVFIMEMCYIMY